MAKEGRIEEVIFAQTLEKGEIASHVPIQWKGFPRKGSEEQLFEQEEGNRSLGLRGEGRGARTL